MPKSTENTVFVRLVPPPTKVLRHELEELFSQMGPIKKSSWIHADNNASKKQRGGEEGGSTTHSSKGYGFVKYLTEQDAQAATNELHDTNITMNGQTIQLKVELASKSSSESAPSTATSKRSPSKQQNRQKDVKSSNGSTQVEGNNAEEDILASKKKLSRVIVRNLSFYAKESHIRKEMENKFGKVIDIHLPKVNNKLHVGFCFVTFENSNDAKKAVAFNKSSPITIQKRDVNIDWSIPKNVHQQQRKQQQENEKKNNKQMDLDKKAQADDKEDSDDDSDSSSDDDSSSSSSSNDDEESNDDDGDDAKGSDGGSSASESGGESDDPDGEEVDQKRTLFLRNLPFDTTRHDLFQLFYKYGHIKGIYLVKDKETGIAKGTAFITYSAPESAQKALDRTASSSFVSQRQATTGSAGDSDNQGSTEGGDKEATDPSSASSSSSLVFRGRSIMVNLAVDKETAATFDSSKSHKSAGTDRRNMYLQAESRVESSNPDHNGASSSGNKGAGYGTWDDIPPQDQRKRQHALKDKTTKLQSPLFFINPNRLSVRNLAKHVDEVTLRNICAQATKRGLQKGLVNASDQIAHWRAPGELSTRDIMSKVQQMEAKEEPIIPLWDDNKNEDADNYDNETKKKKHNINNIRDYIPSEYIDRDFVKGSGTNTKKADAPSRGYGFIEFTHHVHALACLRELNNNPAYSKEYAAGGSIANSMKRKQKKKKPSSAGVGGVGGGNASGGVNNFVGEDGRVLVPRLIVDFVVRLIFRISCRSF